MTRRSAVGAIALALAFLITPVSRAGEKTPAGGPVQFNRDVRGILSDKCFQCHGPDETHRKAKLRLDAFQYATAATDGGDPAIVPGDPDASEMIRRTIMPNQEDPRMPAILEDADWDTWLGETRATPDQAKAVLKTMEDVTWKMAPEQKKPARRSRGAS